MSTRNQMAMTLFGNRFQTGYSTPVYMNTLTPGQTPAPVIGGGTGGGLTGDPYSTLTNAGCNLISNAALRAACIAASGLFRPRQGGGTGGGGGGGGMNNGGGLQGTQCPSGYRWDGVQCRIEGIGSYLPGDVGRPDYAWTAVNGRYGAGVHPVEEARSVARCPSGYALGKDGICYDRLRKSDRLWNPGTKPFLTGGEVRAIRRAKALHRKFKRLSGGKNALFPAAKIVKGGKRRKR